MQKLFKISVLTIIIGSLFVFSCASEEKDESHGSRNSGDRQERPEGQEMQMPTESELVLLKLRSFIDNAQSEPTLAISEEQAAVIVPILQDWEATISSDSDASTESLAEKISAVFSDSQNNYRPAPPNQMEGDDSNRQGPPSGGPEEIDFSSILSGIIADLS